VNKFKAVFVCSAIALVVASVSSAALSSLSMDRAMTGTVLADSNSNVAVQITDLTGNPSFLDINSKGKYSFDLNDAINKNGALNTTNTTNGFNPDALFFVGNATTGAFKIQNNSDIPVTVSLSNTPDAVTLHPQSGTATVAAGASKEFYFIIDTTTYAAGDSLNGTLKLEGTQ
jgi:hypothetical protein